MIPENPTDDEEMHRRVDWMRPSDRPLLKQFEGFPGWLKPATLSLNLPYSRGHIARRCKTLAEHELLERHPDVAAYRLTELGEAFLADELEAGDLEE